MGREVVKRYSNGEITVVWKPAICIHSTLCFQGLPAVFDPSRRPWVDASAASTAEIRAQVGRCPSGALSLGEDAAAPPEARHARTESRPSAAAAPRVRSPIATAPMLGSASGADD